MIAPYLTQNSVEYLIASGGGAGYVTSGIPAAWLIDPNGTIVWQGHPGNLQSSVIEEHLKNARIFPEFDLPKSLSSAQKDFAAGKFGSGIKDLEKFLEDPDGDDEGDVPAAKEALEKALAYGNDQLKGIESLGAEGYYLDAMEQLVLVEKMFRGHEIGDKAKDLRNTWRKDSAVKTELEANAILNQAEDLIREKKYRPAWGYLQRIIQSSKYEETKTRARAEEKIKSIQKFI